jgi:hypothetical protein
MNRLRAEAVTRDPALASNPDRRYFYWSEDVTGSSGMHGYIADMRTGDGSPELDHKQSLAVRWLTAGTPRPGNDTHQADRETDYNVIANLQVISALMNRRKSGGSFVPQVEVNFRGPGDPP